MATLIENISAVTLATPDMSGHPLLRRPWIWDRSRWWDDWVHELPSGKKLSASRE